MGSFVLLHEDFFSLLFSSSFFCSEKFSAAPLSLVSHSSTSHFYPTLEVSGFYSWFTLEPPSHGLCLPPLFLLPPLFSPIFSLLLLNHCVMTATQTVCTGFKKPWGMGWFSLTHVMYLTACFIPCVPGSQFKCLLLPLHITSLTANIPMPPTPAA